MDDTNAINATTTTIFPLDGDYPSLEDYDIWELRGYFDCDVEENILVACRKTMGMEVEAEAIEEYKDAIWEYIYNSYFADEFEVSDADKHRIRVLDYDIVDEPEYRELRSQMPVITIEV